MIVSDVTGDKWDVRQGDPGWKPAQYLSKYFSNGVSLPLGILLDITPIHWLTAKEVVNTGDDTEFLRLAAAIDQQWALQIWYNKKIELDREGVDGTTEKAEAEAEAEEGEARVPGVS